MYKTSYLHCFSSSILVRTYCREDRATHGLVPIKDGLQAPPWQSSLVCLELLPTYVTGQYETTILNGDEAHTPLW
jgi:hypothetical protein